MLKQVILNNKGNNLSAAAFGRLCVETSISGLPSLGRLSQPPSGGCVLKHKKLKISVDNIGQPPSGGCVLKPLTR